MKKLQSTDQPEVKVLHSIYAKMVLDKAIRDFRTEQIRKEIEQSLQERDKEKFLKLTDELKKLH